MGGHGSKTVENVQRNPGKNDFRFEKINFTLINREKMVWTQTYNLLQCLYVYVLLLCMQIHKSWYVRQCKHLLQYQQVAKTNYCWQLLSVFHSGATQPWFIQTGALHQASTTLPCASWTSQSTTTSPCQLDHQQVGVCCFPQSIGNCVVVSALIAFHGQWMPAWGCTSAWSRFSIPVWDILEFIYNLQVENVWNAMLDKMLWVFQIDYIDTL